MAGVFRTGYQAVADAVWSLVAIASRSVNTTYFGGSAGTFSGGKPYAIGTSAGIQGSVSFGSTETSHDSSLAGLSAAAVGEIVITFAGPQFLLDNSNKLWHVYWEIINTTTLRFYRDPHSLQGGIGVSSDLPASTHLFTAERRVLP